MRHWDKWFFLCCTALFSPFASATLTDVQFSGHIDTSYNYLVRSNQFISTVNDRVFDLQQNGFTLQQAVFNAELTPEEGFGFVGQVLVGRDAYTIASYGWNPNYGSQTLGMFVTKAYLQYGFGKLRIIGGMYDSPMGIESYEATKDSNFSRSILNGYAEPGFMLGLRSVYTFNEQVNFLLGIVSGYNTIRFSTHYPSLEYVLNYIPTSKVNFTFQGISGQQRLINNTDTGPVSRRDVLELNAGYQITDPLKLSASYDYGVQRKALLPTLLPGGAVWQGIAGYIDYKFNDKWLGSLRGEIYSDRNGYTTGVRQNWREVTLTLNYRPKKYLLFRGETRHDFSNVSSFVNASGSGVSNNNQSYALEGVYIF